MSDYNTLDTSKGSKTKICDISSTQSRALANGKSQGAHVNVRTMEIDRNGLATLLNI